MNRRQLLCQTPPLLGAAALLPSTLSTAAEMRGKIKKGIKFSMVDEPDLSLVDTFKMLREIGFDGTELRTENHVDYAKYRKAVDQSGLPVHGIVNSSKPDLETAVKFAKDIGATSVLYVAGYDKKRPLMESWDETQAVIRKGLPAAEEHDIQILVENVWASFLISALDMERYVDEIDHPNFGAYFDIGNNARWGVPEHWIELLGSRIKKLDVKEWDVKRQNTEGLRAGFKSELSDGTIDWSAICAALEKIGYNGWATAEVPGGDRTRLADISGRMDQIFKLA